MQTISSSEKKEIGLVVLNYNDALTTIRFVENIIPYEIISCIVVVDNKSTDDSWKVLTEHFGDRVELIQTPKNGGYGYGNNYGIRYITQKFGCKYIIISNPDVSFQIETVYRMKQALDEYENAAIVAPVMCDRNGNRQQMCAWEIPTKAQYILSAGTLLGKIFRFDKYNVLFKNGSNIIKVGCVAGSLFMVRASDMLDFGMYDEKMFLYCEETCLGYKMKQAGKDILLLRDCTFLHLHGASINKSIPDKMRQLKMMLDNREYMLKTYMNASKAEILLAHMFFSLFICERKILLGLKEIGKRITDK